jgi:orotate phosphoribosyltransferase
MHIPLNPSKNPLSFCTYRLEKYRPQTMAFLESNGIKVNSLVMFNAGTKEERNKTNPAVYKASVYKDSNYKLFIESNDNEAQAICSLSKKPVYCFSTGRMYQAK